jgi:glycosyltransferase involved in cell wall biosynthesis
VTDGLDGFIVPPRDTAALAEALAHLDRDRELLREMSRQARLTVRRFDLAGNAAAINRAAMTRREQPIMVSNIQIEIENRAATDSETGNESTFPISRASLKRAKPFRWIVAQEGTRESYAIPVAFQRLALLRTFYVDIWCNRGRSILRNGTAGMRALATHFHSEIPQERIVSFNPEAIWDRTRQHFRSSRSPVETGEKYCHYGSWFASKVRNHLERQELDPAVDCFLGFNTNCLEILEMLRNRKIFTIVDQVDPGVVEEEIVLEEAERWPGWERNPGRMPQSYWSRIKAEWQAAELVLVNSEWSRQALVQQGVHSDKIIEVPLAINLKQEHSPEPVMADGPLKVLWLGNMILRKGIQYLVEAARKMQRQNVEFLLAGPLGISRQAVQSFPNNIKLLGRVTRDQLSDAYKRAHVFVMPTLSDGFGVTQLEAMAHGLPVIATPNCGRVVTNGFDGFIVPPRDSNALAEALARFDGNRSLLREMSRNAQQTVKKFDLPSNAKLINEFALKHRLSLKESKSCSRFTSGRALTSVN